MSSLLRINFFIYFSLSESICPFGNTEAKLQKATSDYGNLLSVITIRTSVTNCSFLAAIFGVNGSESFYSKKKIMFKEMKNLYPNIEKSY